ncbi:odorant receptor 131-2-like [Syngnathus typhle]|uniref:odorant receptor 131-2-like n=1 Tax=Syngnathus typhle TaxID=161592 RepID=UPI002A6AB074|nr:odorant receptor 131-2-like [Syngnathus typhle]
MDSWTCCVWFEVWATARSGPVTAISGHVLWCEASNTLNRCLLDHLLLDRGPSAAAQGRGLAGIKRGGGARRLRTLLQLERDFFLRKVSAGLMEVVSAGNATAAARASLSQRAAVGVLTTGCCAVFLFVNGWTLFTLQSKSLFRETSRYVLLFNLLLADTLYLSLSQLLYLLSNAGVSLRYSACGALVLLANLLGRISPLVLALMSLERYVAVCRPLRHVSVATAGNTARAVLAAWTVSCLNVVVQGLLLKTFPFERMTAQLCTFNVFFLSPVSKVYYDVFSCFLFAWAGSSILFSFVGVALSARSAATDKESLRKAGRTLLLHLLHLVLSLTSVLYGIIMAHLAASLSRLDFVLVQTLLFVCFVQLPRCLGSLIYGLRDRSLRAALLYVLCCHVRVSRSPVGGGRPCVLTPRDAVKHYAHRKKKGKALNSALSCGCKTCAVRT